MKLKVRPAVVALVTLFAQCDSPATGVKHHHRPRPPLMKCFRLALAGLVINRYQTITKHCASSSASVCTPLIGRYCAVGISVRTTKATGTQATCTQADRCGLYLQYAVVHHKCHIHYRQSSFVGRDVRLLGTWRRRNKEGWLELKAKTEIHLSGNKTLSEAISVYSPGIFNWLEYSLGLGTICN